MTLAASDMPRNVVLQSALRSTSFMAGALIAGLFILIALGSFLWTPYDYAAQDIPNKLKGLIAAH